MSLISSLNVGASGLETAQDDLSVIGNNIANANTVGFKEGRANFEDAMSESLIGVAGVGQLGMGAQLENVQQIMQQGSITQTGNATDLALKGNGFFMVNGNFSGQSQNYYTRAGQFTLNNQGQLQNPQGLLVQGYMADANGNLSSTVGNLDIGKSTTPPKETNNITMQANLQPDAPVLAFDPLNPSTTSNFSTDTTVYDTLGQAHDVQTYFNRTAAGDWNYTSLTDGGGIQGGTPGTAQEIAAGTMTFDNQGRLSTVTPDAAQQFMPNGAVDPQTLNFNFGDQTTPIPPAVTGGTGLTGITQFAASTSSLTAQSQDGYGLGTLSSESIDPNGVITGSFSNGVTHQLGQIAVASFTADDQLESAGSNLYAATQLSGPAAVGAASTGGRGAIQAGALEQSNVDLSNEFVNMIAAQENYQADAKTITTAQDCLQTLMQMKQ